MSCPASRMALAASALRSSASAQAKTVMGRPRSAKSRISRQKPTRLPYSNMLSAARSRSPRGTAAAGNSVKAASLTPSRSIMLYSEPSS